MASQHSSSLTARSEIDAAVRDWLQSGRQVLHVEGSPGSGKTSWVEMLVAAAGVLGADGRRLAQVAAHHYCRRDDVRSASAVVFFERVAVQLAQLEPCFGQALTEHIGRRRGVHIDVKQDMRHATVGSAVGVQLGQLIAHGLAPGDLLEELLAPLSEVLVEDGPDWLIVVDAPDEPTETGVAELLVALGPLPKRLRWIITSRPNVPFGRRLEATGADRLDLSVVGAGSPSLARFLEESASNRGLLARLAPGLGAETFVDALIERARDNFLIAHCAVDALAAQEAPLDLAAVGRLPTDLPGFYRSFLGELPQELLGSWCKECGPLLGSLVVAREPLGEAELAAITGLRHSLVRDRLTRLRAFLEGERRGWRLFHATFAEFLLDGEEAEEYWCPENEQHERLLNWMTASGGWEAAPAYGLSHFVSHVVAADAPTLPEQLDRAIEPEFVRARLARGEPAHVLADEDRKSVV